MTRSGPSLRHLLIAWLASHAAVHASHVNELSGTLPAGETERLRFSDDGAHLLKRSRSGGVTVWRVEDGEEVLAVAPWSGGRAPFAWRASSAVHRFVRSPQSGGDESGGTVRVTEVGEDASERTVRVDADLSGVEELHLSADGTLLAGVQRRRRDVGRIVVVHLETGEVVFDAKPLGDRSPLFRFVPGSSCFVAAVDKGNPTLIVVDYESGKIVTRNALQQGVENLVVSGAGDTIATGGDADLWKIYSHAEGQLRLRGTFADRYADSELTQAGLTTLGRLWVGNYRLQIWDPDTQQLDLSFTGGAQVAVSPSGEMAAIAMKYRSPVIVTLAELRHRRLATARRKAPRGVWMHRGAALSGTNAHLTTAKYQTAYHLDLLTGGSGERVAADEAGKSPETRQAISSDGHVLITNTDAETVTLVPHEGSPRTVLRLSGKEEVAAVGFSQAGDRIVVTTSGRRALVLTLGGELVSEVSSVNRSSGATLCLSGSGRWLVVQDTVFDVQRNLEVRKFAGSLGFSPDERYLVSRGGLLDLESMTILPGHIFFPQVARDVSLSLDTPHLVSLGKEREAGGRHEAHVWNYLTGRLLGRLVGEPGDLENVRISPSGDYVAAYESGWGSTVLVWDIADWVREDLSGQELALPMREATWPAGGRRYTSPEGIDMTIRAPDGASVVEVERFVRETLRRIEAESD